MTGYLTQRGSEDDGRYRLVIPNREIRNIVTDNILSLFQDEVKKKMVKWQMHFVRH